MSAANDPTTTLVFPFRLLIAAAVLRTFGYALPKVMPGGSFISVSGELLPIVIAVLACCFSFLRLRDASGVYRLGHVGICLSATFIAGHALRSILDFWLSPSARGDLFGL